MCYNCGCQMPNNDMGKTESITNKTFEKAADAMETSPEEARRNAYELLEKVLDSDEKSRDTYWKP